ncbi:MAG: acetyltransferase [Dehalococcoidia bacterium]
MDKQEDLVLIGDGEYGQIAYEYFTYDSPYRVVAFCAERDFLKRDELLGLPVVPFEQLEQAYSPNNYKIHVAITYTQLNRVRTRLYLKAKEKGYKAATYVSSKAFVWHNVKIGENCFIFENNVIQHMVEIGNNVVLWSGNHIGHRTKIGDNCYISSHVVISGYCEIGEYSFLGVNTALEDKIKIGKDCITGVGTVVVKDLEPGKVYVGSPARALGKSSYETFNVPENAR